jgi:hypothetical protein
VPVLSAALQYLCCEVAALQQHGLLRQLRVLDVAHMAWRLQVTCRLEAAMQAQLQVRQWACSVRVLPPGGHCHCGRGGHVYM